MMLGFKKEYTSQPDVSLPAPLNPFYCHFAVMPRICNRVYNEKGRGGGGDTREC